MEWCLAIIMYQGVWLEAGPTDSSAQGHTPSSSSLSISARYGETCVITISVWICVYETPDLIFLGMF